VVKKPYEPTMYTPNGDAQVVWSLSPLKIMLFSLTKPSCSVGLLTLQPEGIPAFYPQSSQREFSESYFILILNTDLCSVKTLYNSIEQPLCCLCSSYVFKSQACQAGKKASTASCKLIKYIDIEGCQEDYVTRNVLHFLL